MKKLLVVDDEKNIRNVIKEYASFNGYTVKEAKDGQEAIDICKEENFDIIVMDLMMPRVDGYSACRKIKSFADIPIIFLSARGEEYDKLFGFEMGIDDYVTKPVSPKELIARINAVVTRKNAVSNREAPEEKETVYRHEGMEINTVSRELTIDGSKVDLTPKEYDLLVYLMKNKNVALSRDQLLSEVWGYDFYGDDRTVDTHIKNLRNSMGEYRDLIVIVRAVGYKFTI